MARPGVLVTRWMLPELHQALEERFAVCNLWAAKGEEGALLKQHGGAIRAVVTNATAGASADLMRVLPGLEIVASFSVGVDKVDLPLCRQRGIRVTNTPDVLTDCTADLAVLLMLAAARRLCPADRFVRNKLWTPQTSFPLAHKASGKRVGIVGLGRIGSAIARRLEAFGCEISYHGRSLKGNAPYAFYSRVTDLATKVDVLVISCALTKETHHLINRQVMDALGPQGTLVNVARGSVVDEAELVRALVEGRVGAAGLDVFEDEPNVPDELLKMENVVLTPHVGSDTLETSMDMANLVVANLEAHFSGRALLTPVC